MASLSKTADNSFSPDDEGFYEQVYDELRKLAHSKMSREYKYSTLQGTALVHEAWLRLGGDEQPQWQNRGHFFGAALEAMRRILVDRANKRNRPKHGGELRRVPEDHLNEIPSMLELNDEFLQINEALNKLAEIDPEKAKLVKSRFILGMSIEETAKKMDISTATAKRWWTHSRTWLRRELSRA